VTLTVSLRKQRINGGKTAVEVLVHSSFGEVQSRFVIVLISREFLTNVIILPVFLICRSICSVRFYLFAKGQEISARDDLSKSVDDYSRASELVGDRVSGCRMGALTHTIAV